MTDRNLDTSTSIDKSAYFGSKTQNDQHERCNRREEENTIIDMHGDLIELYLVFFGWLMLSLNDKKE